MCLGYAKEICSWTNEEARRVIDAAMLEWSTAFDQSPHLHDVANNIVAATHVFSDRRFAWDRVEPSIKQVKK